MRDQADKQEQSKASEQPPIGLAEFLVSQSPGSQATVRDIALAFNPIGRERVSYPEILLHCPSDECGEVRTFRHDGESGSLFEKEWRYWFLSYVCRYCEKSRRVYALAIYNTCSREGGHEVCKIGERPPFAPPLPARVIALVGPDRDLFLKGRRAENQGLGVGAFAYYRRVVESQWQRLVDEIIRVAERVNAPGPMLEVLRRAAEETQFSKAVDLIKDGVPEALKISGHNPLTLLYRALSEGVHDKTDDECLNLASSVRIVLTELAERITQALKDERELQGAVTRLLQRSIDKKTDIPGATA